MKKNYLLLLLLLLIPFSVKAEASMTVTCDQTNVDPNATVTCEAKVFDSVVSGGEGTIVVDNGTLKSITPLYCAVGEAEGDHFSCIDEIVSATATIVRFEVQTASSGSTTISINNAKVVGGDDFDTIEVNVTPLTINTRSYVLTLNNQGATTPETASVNAYFNSAIPTITVPKKVYTLTYNYNGNGQSNTTATSTFTFGGYYSATSGVGTQYITATGTSAINYDLHEDKTLYAKWTGGSITLPNPTREDYVFTGWYSAPTNGTKIGNASTEYTPSANKTLYAQWKEILKSESYEVKQKKVIVKPAEKEYKQNELESNVETANDIEIYDHDNKKISNTDPVGTGYKIKTSNVYYDVVVLGDITGDGLVQIGDVSALYNHYRGKKTLKGVYLEAGLLTGNDEVMIGDIARLYNFYKGNRSL